MAFDGTFTDKRVLITGHTGFKGSWLTEWMLSLGAQVHGFALAPEEGASLFRDLGLASRMRMGTWRRTSVISVRSGSSSRK